MPGEGKSTVVRNLALAFREAGKTVVVVDLDLRHPSLQRLFAVPGRVGATEVLRHEVDLDDALLRVEVELDPFDAFMLARAGDQSALNGVKGTNGHVKHPEITLLMSGALPANPAAVLASGRTVEVLDALRDRFDIVIIDSAPVLAVSDTISLLRYADIALFVGRLNVTTRDTAKRLMDVLDRVPDMVLAGVVANDLPRLEASGYGYGYGYGYGGAAGSSEAASVPVAPTQPV
jgi:receptor protein-tyrosine kinase